MGSIWSLTLGTWSAALFGNDIAIDVRFNYMEYLRSGMSNAKATRQIIADYEDELADEYEASIVWCALAATQWKVGRLQKNVRNKALRAIKNGGDLPRWEEENTPREVASRRRVLAALRKKLETDPPAETKIRIQKPAPKPAKQNDTQPPWKKGEIIAFDVSAGNVALLFVEGNFNNDGLGHETFFTVMDWNGKRIPDASKLQKLNLLLDAACICNHESDPIPWDRIKRLNVKRRGRGNIFIGEHGVGGFQTDCTWQELPKWIKKNRTKKHQAYLELLS